MSSRPVLVPFKVIDDGDMSDDIVSDVTVIKMLSHVSYAITWTGTSPVGEMSVEVSNDYEQNADGSVRNAGTWTALPLSEMATVSGNSDAGFIDVYATSAFAMRLVFTRTSGTGTMNATIAAKVA